MLIMYWVVLPYYSSVLPRFAPKLIRFRPFAAGDLIESFIILLNLVALSYLCFMIVALKLNFFELLICYLNLRFLCPSLRTLSFVMLQFSLISSLSWFCLSRPFLCQTTFNLILIITPVSTDLSHLIKFLTLHFLFQTLLIDWFWSPAPYRKISCLFHIFLLINRIVTVKICILKIMW